MKTSILISSFAALCLLLTFAETPHRYDAGKITFPSTDNISIVTTERATLLPGVVITPHRTLEPNIPLPVVPEDEFSYLKFDVNEYVSADAFIPEETGILPEITEIDFSYLKFNVNDYYTISDLNTNETGLNGLEYLRFDVNEYMINDISFPQEIAELPLNEEETTNEFNYLRFDVSKYYTSTSLDTDTYLELPEE